MTKKDKDKDKRFGKMAVKLEFIEKEHYREARKVQKAMKKMGIVPKPMEDILVEKEYLTPPQVEQVKVELKKKARPKVKIEGYEILDLLGKGAMGKVYKARQKSLDRIVAVKILNREWGDNEVFIKRFLREAKATGKLNSPHVVTGYDIGQIDDGQYYLVMEYIDGQPLYEILKKGRLPIKRSLEIAIDVARALAVIHKAGFIHRDVKPGNILVHRDSEGAKLCDLGLAKPMEGSADVTTSGMIVGSPHYLSPEQARDETLDIRSDIYGLGVILYQMTTGTLPFDGDGKTPLEIIAQAAKEKVPPPSETNSDLPEVIDYLVGKMTSLSPRHRYFDPTALLADLEGALQDQPLPSREDPITSDSRGTSSTTTPAVRRRGRKKGKKSRKKVAPTSSTSESTSTQSGETGEKESSPEKDRTPSAKEGSEVRDAVPIRRKLSARQKKNFIPAMIAFSVTALAVLYFLPAVLKTHKEVKEAEKKKQDQKKKKTTKKKRDPSTSPDDPQTEKKTVKEELDSLTIAARQFDPQQREKIRKYMKKFIAKYKNNPEMVSLAKVRLKLLNQLEPTFRQARKLDEKGNPLAALETLRTFAEKLSPHPALDRSLGEKTRRLMTQIRKTNFERDWKAGQNAVKGQKFDLARTSFRRILTYGDTRQIAQAKQGLKKTKKEEMKQAGLKDRVDLQAYGELIEQVLPPLATLQWDQALAAVNRNFHYDSASPLLRQYVKGLLADIGGMKKVMTLARLGMESKVGVENTAIALKSGGFKLGRILKVTPQGFKFLIRGHGVTHFYAFDQIKPGQLVQLARTYLKSTNQLSAQKWAYPFGNIYLLVFRDVDKAVEYFTQAFGLQELHPPFSRRKVPRLAEDFPRTRLHLQWMRFQLQYEKGRGALDRKRWLVGLDILGNLHQEMAEEAFYGSRAPQIQKLLQNALGSSQLSSVIHGNVYLDQGGLCIAYDFRDESQLKDWKAKTTRDGQGKGPGWQWKDGALVGNLGPELTWIPPLSGGARIEVTFTCEGKKGPSFAVLIGGRVRGGTKEGILAGLNIPFGNPVFFRYTKKMAKKGVFLTGLFQYDTTKKVRDLAMYPLLDKKISGEQRMVVDLEQSGGLSFQWGDDLDLQTRGKIQGPYISLCAWRGPIKVTSIKIYGVPRPRWLEKRRREIR